MPDLINNNFLVYQSEDGSTRVDVRLDNENIWLKSSLPSCLVRLKALFPSISGTSLRMAS